MCRNGRVKQCWSAGVERERAIYSVHAMGVAARFAYGAHLGLSMRVVCEHEHAVRDLEVAWTTGLMYILSGLFVRRVRVEIITFSRAKSLSSATLCRCDKVLRGIVYRCRL